MRKIRPASVSNLERLKSLFTEYIPPIRPEATPYLVIESGLLLFSRKHALLRIPLAIFTFFTAFFFRNPSRVSPQSTKVMVAPADGTVTEITTVNGPAELGLENKKFLRISIFLSIFNVHTQRIPQSGTVKNIKYLPGEFLSADRAEAVEVNERNHVLIETPEKEEYIVTQVAGTIARRIKCYLTVNQKVTTGETYGLIKFGSRLNILVPTEYKPNIMVGQHTLAGETILASKK